MAAPNTDLGDTQTTTFHIAANDVNSSRDENATVVSENFTPPTPINIGAGENESDLETKESHVEKDGRFCKYVRFRMID